MTSIRANTFWLSPIACALWSVSAFSQTVPKLIVTNGARLAEAKDALHNQSGRLYRAVRSLIRDADEALKQKPVTVTSKKQIPPGGDKRDYMSLAPYWWPDSSKKDGLPYIRRDGQVNPERFEYKDRELVATLQYCATTLAAAWFITGKQEYAEHAANMLRVWFVDSSTRMNPNMSFSEAIRGRNAGRGAGIMGLAQLPTILDAVILLRSSKYWSVADEAEVVSWGRSYLNWLRTSPNGIDEQDAPNNHGTWYDVQLASLALFTGLPDTAKRIIEAAKSMRIASQIEPDGRMPKELERTRGIGYSSFNLLAMASLATIAGHVGIDLWHFETPDGRGIRKAIDWIVPYYEGARKWEYQQISEWDPDEAVMMLVTAGSALGGPYAEIAIRISKNQRQLLRTEVLR
jgi:hypothetical protein